MTKNNCLMGPKYCPDCGKELESYTTKCNFCGKDFINKEKSNKSK